jgi:hypothetical protein
LSHGSIRPGVRGRSSCNRDCLVSFTAEPVRAGVRPFQPEYFDVICFRFLSTDRKRREK